MTSMKTMTPIYTTRGRLEMWVGGKCPYCELANIIVIPLKKGVRYMCLDCGATNQFSNKNMIGEVNHD